MTNDLIAILIFGLIGYLIRRVPKPGAFRRLDIVLLVLLILIANMHGSNGFGFIGIGNFRMYTSPILQGIIGGILMKGMTSRIATTT